MRRLPLMLLLTTFALSAISCQTSESDENVLEYYETWNEEEFPDTYSGGASLSRCE